MTDAAPLFSATIRRSRRSLTVEQRRAALEADKARRSAARKLSRDREVDGMPWFVLQTAPLCERRVELALISLGLCVYLPEGKRWFRPRRPMKGVAYIERVRVAFPRYMFVGFPDAKRPDPKVDGVMGVLGMGNGVERIPVLITGAQIAALREAQEAGAMDFGKNPTRYDHGQHVEILHPLLRGLTGLICSKKIDGGYKVDLGWLSAMPIVSVDLLRKAA
ncbi:transcription termination/antitermination NusG family protein [Methylopila sp. 73B]|uniref:transcription termination/antitermination NusG family protein n=1 Tax=Methylopila sp. 73B TaxID=1120792 RepID=UPI000376919C|nr:transcription termination/antitermination NusG family protein [Methylopila sp. 73B]